MQSKFEKGPEAAGEARTSGAAKLAYVAPRIESFAPLTEISFQSGAPDEAVDIGGQLVPRSILGGSRE